mgnify:CR=1 FL=1
MPIGLIGTIIRNPVLCGSAAASLFSLSLRSSSISFLKAGSRRYLETLARRVSTSCCFVLKKKEKRFFFVFLVEVEEVEKKSNCLRRRFFLFFSISFSLPLPRSFYLFPSAGPPALQDLLLEPVLLLLLEPLLARGLGLFAKTEERLRFERGR